MYKIRVHGGSKHSFEHNNRTHDMSVEYGEHHDDMEVWYDRSKDMNKVYEDLFGKAIEKFNEKQGSKHKERQTSVEEYLNKQRHTLVKGSKKGEYEEDNQECFEVILSVGSMDNQPNRETQKNILKKFYQDWEKNYPNLKLVQVAYHGDEKGVPHLHIDFIPIAHKEKGLGVQVEWKGAAKEMGIEWKEKQTYINDKGEEKTKTIGGKEVIHSMLRKEFGNYCREYGLEIDIEPKADREELDVWEYKRQQEQKNIEDMNKQLQAIKDEISDNVKDVERIRANELKKPEVPHLQMEEKGVIKKEWYVKHEDLKRYDDEVQKVVNKANEIIWKQRQNDYAYDHNAWKVKELEQTLSHYRKDDLVQDNERLMEENDKLKNNVDKYRNLYDRECQEHQETKEQLQSKEKSLHWYQSMYEELIKFIDKLEMNGISLLNHFMKDKPQKTQEYIEQDINQIHQEEELMQQSQSKEEEIEI